MSAFSLQVSVDGSGRFLAGAHGGDDGRRSRYRVSAGVDALSPEDATEEEKYEAGKAFAEKFCRPGKLCSFSLYSPPVMTDAFAKGLYETSRRILEAAD